jgi:hypothetical protein
MRIPPSSLLSHPRLLGFFCILFGMIAAETSFGATPDILVVTVDQARVVKVPEGTQTLVIGNPIMADVTLLKQNNTMIVTGKGFGETNLIALDHSGNPIAESTIKVIGTNNSLVVQRGMDRQSYTCEPRCQPTVKLGDDAKYFGDIAGQIQARNAQAAGQAGAK